MDYLRYSEMKDSGIEWIGKIPKDWKVAPLKFVTKCLDNQRIPLNSEERAEMKGEYPYYGANGIVDYVNDYLFDESIILLGEDGAPFNEFGKDVAFFIEEKCWVNNHAHILKAIDINSKFLTYALNSVNYSPYLSGSTRDKLTQTDMNNIKIPYPSVKEQNRIANFLDQEIAKIDKLIEKKEKLIELLEEKRQAMINETITKGLNSDVPMKDAGIEWLGEIPEHWETIKLSRKFKIINGGTPKSSNEEYWNGEIVWITPADLSKLDSPYINYSNRKISRKGKQNSSATLVPKNSIVISKRAPIGYVAISKVELSTNQGCYSLVIKTKEEINIKYFYYYMNSIESYLKILGQGSTFTELSSSDLGEVKLLFPTLKEQNSISNFLDQKIKKINKLIEKIKQQIVNFKEYRKTLISKAVTGKIDVRELV